MQRFGPHQRIQSAGLSIETQSRLFWLRSFRTREAWQTRRSQSEAARRTTERSGAVEGRQRCNACQRRSREIYRRVITANTWQEGCYAR